MHKGASTRPANAGLKATGAGSRKRRRPPTRLQHGCTPSIRWVKQVTSSWKLTYLDAKHGNCEGATSSAIIRGMDDEIENIFQNDNTISGMMLQAAVTVATLSLRSIMRVKKKLVQPMCSMRSLCRSSARTYVSWRNILQAR